MKLQWTDSLHSCFKQAQLALKDLKSITIPRPDDKLIITSDGAVKKGGVGSVLHIFRKGYMKLGGFYSAKLKPHQSKWLPCEVEALAIGSSVNHWAPYILESKHTVQILTDSKPCVQAFSKLCRGEFSHSARVSTFLSTLSRYQVTVQYIQGCSNLPADYQSRNPAECSERNCQVCKFIDSSDICSVRNITVADILEGRCSMPFVSPMAWKVSQQDCKALRRVHAHLSQGTRPNHKANNIKDVKRYLHSCTIGRDGLLIVRKQMPFSSARDLTVIPRHILPGFLSALHLSLNHPTTSQIKEVFHKYFYALDADLDIPKLTSTCAQCMALASLPKSLEKFSTSEQQPTLGSDFACDVLCRARQRIFLIRDNFSSYTMTKLIANEQRDTLKAALIETTAELKATNGCTVRIDGATGFQSLVADKSLSAAGIQLEPGRIKNRNKNPIAEKAIQELEHELKRAHPDGGPISESALAKVTATLNSRVRNRGLSAREIVFQRDGLSGEQLNFSDKHLAEQQHSLREASHGPSARCQAKNSKPSPADTISVGDLVYVKSDGDKHTSRDKYIVTAIDKSHLYAKKLTGHQFRAKAYQLKRSEVFPVPTPCTSSSLHKPHDSADTESDDSDSNRSSHEPLHQHLDDSDSGSSDLSISEADDPPIPVAFPMPMIEQPLIPPEPPPNEDSSISGQSADEMNDNLEEDSNVSGQSANEASDNPLEDNVEEVAHAEPQPAGRPQRRRALPTHLKDYQLSNHSDDSD